MRAFDVVIKWKSYSGNLISDELQNTEIKFNMQVIKCPILKKNNILV